MTGRLTLHAESSELPYRDGARTTTGWLAGLTGSSPREARNITVIAGAAKECEQTFTAWQHGTISTTRARIVVDAITSLPAWCGPTERDAAETDLLHYATELSLPDLKRVANHVLEVIDPDGADEHLAQQLAIEEANAFNACTLVIRQARDGMRKGEFLLPALHADMLETVIEGLSAPRRTNASIHDVEPDGDASMVLSRDRRWGIALCELIEHLPTDALPQHGGLAATLTVTIDHERLKTELATATLSTGTDITAAQARRLACNAGILPMVLDGPSRVLDLAPTTRLFDQHQRLALAQRDGGCCWPDCDRPPAWCEAHHLKPYSHGGPTTINNGALFCFYHHHRLHAGDWTAHLAPDNTVELIPPVSIDPHRQPRRNTRHVQPQPRPPD